MPARRFTDEQELMICKEYINGLSGTEIAKKYSTNSTTTYRVLEKNGIKRRIRTRKYRCNDCFFDKINTIKKAYWLGFFEADGSATGKGNRITIGLARKDKNHLKKFLADIEADNPIYDKKRFSKKYNKFYFGSVIGISSRQMKKALLRHKDNNYSSVPDKFKSHFIRGLFDGDGGISKYYQFTIRIKPLLINIIQEYLMKKCDLSKTKITKDNDFAWLMSYTGRIQLRRIYDFLYKDAIVYMERKRTVFIKIEKNRLKKRHLK